MKQVRQLSERPARARFTAAAYNESERSGGSMGDS